MINEQIMTYVAGERLRGVTDDAIRGALLSQGWKEEDVSSAMGFGAVAVSSGPKEFSFGNLFEGRLGRWQYFITVLLLSCAGIAVMFVSGLVSALLGKVMFLIIIPLCIALIPLSYALAIRRLHDLNWSGWLLLLCFIPFLGFIFALIVLFKKGTDGPNTYGPPQTDRSFKNTLLNL